ncbi:MAG: hypothetical protein HYS68_03175 [Candidatus Levybacteria bacterium]|nr:hypothetical protein [Candidatus Levybacteria bacterium]
MSLNTPFTYRSKWRFSSEISREARGAGGTEEGERKPKRLNPIIDVAKAINKPSPNIETQFYHTIGYKSSLG